MREFAAFFGITLLAGLGILLTGTSSAPMQTVEYTNTYNTPVIQRIDGEIYEYPSIEDAAIITNIPDSVIIRSIGSEQLVGEYDFEWK